MKKFFEEFKAFALKGNMMDMAIGVIIGGAFSTLVTSLTDNLISPILGILGKVNFDAMMWDVFGDGKLVFKYGAFITVRHQLPDHGVRAVLHRQGYEQADGDGQA